MPSIKDLKKRIGSVKNTQQTTKAMKMVSAAKLRRAQDAINNHRPYAKRMGNLIKLVSAISDSPIDSPLVRKKDVDAEAKKKVLLVVVTSDRGLCGGFNGNIIKAAHRWVKENSDKYEVVKLGFVGRKGHDFFKNRKVEMGPYYAEVGGKVVFAKAKKLAESLIELYLSDQVDEVKFVYNEFRNAVSQRVVIEDFLPLAGGEGEAEAAAPELGLYLVKPGHVQMLEQLLAKNFSVQAFRILLESQAGEHGARMSAMENATKNAGEMIRKLTLQYNKQRQAGITKELLEIISGSESQKSSA